MEGDEAPEAVVVELVVRAESDQGTESDTIGIEDLEEEN